MENIFLVSEKVIYLILLIICGIFVKKFNLVSDKGIEDLSKILIDFFWPVLIFYQISSSLNASDIINNISLPLFAIITGVVGYIFGLLFVKIFRYQDNTKKIFLYNSTINNFVFMVIPFVKLFFPENGLGLLFIHNVGFIIIIWTIGIFIFQGQLNIKESLKGLINPGLVTTLFAILITLVGINKFIPRLVFDVFKTMGEPTFAIAMIVVGAQIYKLSKEEFKFSLSNITIALNRLILIPLILFILSYYIKDFFPREVIGIFMIVNVMPVSIISVSMAIRFDSDPDLAAQHVVSNHLISIITIPVFIMLIEYFLL
jgi:predicted permease